MQLSVCSIARNEGARLPGMLRSVAGVAAETIVVDTGSTDDTAAVATAHGARVGQFPWCDDFSAARNHAIGLARSDWILWLDADEELLPESVAPLQAALARPDLLVGHVLRFDLARATSTTEGTWMWQTRLFRRDTGLRFLGRCHPHFVPSEATVARERGLKVEFLPEIRLRHWGYLGDLRPQKLARGARLLRLELQDRPGQFYYEVELGRTLLLLGDAEGHTILAAAARKLAARRREPRSPESLAPLLLEYLLTAATPAVQAVLSPREADRLAERWYPQSAPLLWARARVAFATEEFGPARSLLRRLLALRHAPGDATTSFDPRILGEDAVLNLAVCEARLGNLMDAETLLAPLAGHPRLGPAATTNLAAIRQLRQQFGV